MKPALAILGEESGAGPGTVHEKRGSSSLGHGFFSLFTSPNPTSEPQVAQCIFPLSSYFCVSECFLR